MSPEQAQHLYTEFPMLYRMRHIDSPSVCCGWKGIDCKDGWFELLQNLSSQIVAYANLHHLDPLITRIRRRAGALCVEVDCDDDHIQDMCQQALVNSRLVCEVCGEPGAFSHDAPFDIKVCCHRHEVEDKPLSQDEIFKLSVFNEMLRKLENEIAVEGKKHVEVLARRVADPLDPLDDFEINAVVCFYLREDDPAYRDDDDNILTKRSHYRVPKNTEEENTRLDSTDWNDRQGGWGIPNHCWMFHDLYDHEYGPGQQRISMHDILRIGLIWINIEIQAQMFRNEVPQWS